MPAVHSKRAFISTIPLSSRAACLGCLMDGQTSKPPPPSQKTHDRSAIRTASPLALCRPLRASGSPGCLAGFWVRAGGFVLTRLADWLNKHARSQATILFLCHPFARSLCCLLRGRASSLS
jgi:hypothetical protein